MVKNAPTTDEPIRDVSADPTWEWKTVADESPTTVIFDTIGEAFVGQYKGSEHIVTGKIDEKTGKPEEFDRFLFRARDSQPYAINKSYKLDAAMEDVEIDAWVRITYVKDIPTNRNLNPLKDFKVDVRK